MGRKKGESDISCEGLLAANGPAAKTKSRGRKRVILERGGKNEGCKQKFWPIGSKSGGGGPTLPVKSFEKDGKADQRRWKEKRVKGGGGEVREGGSMNLGSRGTLGPLMKTAERGGKKGAVQAFFWTKIPSVWRERKKIMFGTRRKACRGRPLVSRKSEISVNKSFPGGYHKKV